MARGTLSEPERRRVARAVVLAAGGSSRMGTPKALLPLAGRAVVAHHCERLAGWADRVVVVLGAGREAIAAALPAGVAIVVNDRWSSTGPLDSLALGLEARLSAPGPVASALVLPVDVLPPWPETLARLLEAAGDAVPVGPDGQEGHPVRLGSATIARLLRRERPEGGLRTLLRDAERVAVKDPRVGWDFDDPAAWERAQAAFGRD